MLEFLATFTVVSIMDPYHVILGRTSVNAHRIVASPFHRKAKFPTPHGIGEVIGNQTVSQPCYVQAVTTGELPVSEKEGPIITEEDPREDKERPSPVEDLKEVELDGPEKLIRIGTKLPLKSRKTLSTCSEDIRSYSLGPQATCLGSARRSSPTS